MVAAVRIAVFEALIDREVRDRDGRRRNLEQRVIRAAVLALVGPALLTASGLAGQARSDPPPPGADSAMVAPGPRYAAGGLRRALLGNGWRDLWLTPTSTPVFDFDGFAGGVRWTRRGGGNMSITLHLESVDGWTEFIFRSVDKFPEQAMPPEIRGTAAGDAIRDMVASLFPAAPLLVPPLADALDLLHVDPALRVMPADPRLAVYLDTFAGMPGTVELQPNEAPGDEPGFAGSRKIKGTEEFLDDLEASKAHRLDERRYLAARLLDFLINDTDRTSDNMRWARFGEESAYRWEPIPIDRDFAFHDAGGWVARAVGSLYPKLTAYGPDYPPLQAFTYSSHQLDRRLLQRLTRSDFEAVAEEVRGAITDEVIERAVARMPERWRRETDAADRVRAALRGRRDGLGDVALDFYRHLAREVDVRGTDEPDRATIRRFPDGRVRVTIEGTGGPNGEPHFDRTFEPAETGEVRLHLHGGADTARVVGEWSRQVTVRVVGGGGDDVLVDEAGGATHLYDNRGDDRLVGTRRTRVSTEAWTPPEPTEGLRIGGAWVPDWGGSRGWSPHLGYGDASGVVLGLGPRWTRYGFRRLPHRWRVAARVLYATADNSLGAELGLDFRPESSPLALTLAARAIPFASFRFNGYGNASPDAGPAGLVEQDLITVSPAVAWHIGWRDRETPATLVGAGPVMETDSLRPLAGRLEAGPVLLWTDPRPSTGAPLTDIRPDLAGFARLGLRAALELDRTGAAPMPRRGWRLEATGAVFPVGDVASGFHEAGAALAAYVPLPGGGPHVAVRLGGQVAGEGAPVEHAAWVGGRGTLRGHRWQRYRGDVAAHGSTELRVPVAPVELLIRWDLGVFALADVGRVWVDGESPGGWHTGVGGGVWLSALGQAVTIAYARGEADRFYLQLGPSF